MKTHRVFVYGTLLTGERNHHIVQPFLLHKEPGKIKGQLYNVETYPALTIGTQEREVVGEWFTVTNEGLKQMDLLEDYEQNRRVNHYERVLIKDIEKEIEGFVYTYLQEKSHDLELISSGSWREFTLGEKKN